jgi:hypothetical protein
LLTIHCTLFHISDSIAVRQETRDELCWGVPCLVTVMAQYLPCPLLTAFAVAFGVTKPLERWFQKSNTMSGYEGGGIIGLRGFSATVFLPL